MAHVIVHLLEEKCSLDAEPRSLLRFGQDLSLDEQSLRALVRRQIDAGINFLCPCGTTGESPTLTHEEHLRVVEITVEEARGRIAVLAGAGGYNTREVIDLIAELKSLGRAGILSVTPYYNKPTQEGLYQHYKAIAESTSLPIMVYSVQPRTASTSSLQPCSARRNSKHCRREGSVRQHFADGEHPRSRARIFHRRFR